MATPALAADQGADGRASYLFSGLVILAASAGLYGLGYATILGFQHLLNLL